MRKSIGVLLCVLTAGCSAQGDPLPSPSAYTVKGEAAAPHAFADDPWQPAPDVAKEGSHAQLKSMPRHTSDPCTSDDQCAGGKCLDVTGQNQNYCTQSCESQACPSDSSCYNFSVGRYCLKSCTQSAQCHPWLICDQDATCWPGDNPIDTEPRPKAALAEPCTAHDQCEGGLCLREVAGTGYCSQVCNAGGCPDGAMCYPFSSGGRCLKQCTASSQCASWLICDQDYTCWPGDNPIDDDEPPPEDPVEPPPEPVGSAVGGACDTADDCQEGGYCYPYTVQGDPTGFIDGYCLVNQCTPGSCPDGSKCKAIYVGGGTACVKTCGSHSDCRSDEGYGCVAWSGDEICWPRCTATGCPSDYVCDSQRSICVPKPDEPDTPPPGPTVGPGAGPGPACNDLPPKHCNGSGSYCGQLLPFDPDDGPGYVDYPLNGESWSNQYRSYARRDLIMLIKWATAYVACKSVGWSGGNGHPLGLGDMSEGNGAIPGTSDGDPGHPPGTHVNGRDMDIAYYQQTGPNNYLRPVCPHGGAYHCTAPPNNLDKWRTALFIGALLTSERTRVIGVDGQIGPIVEDAIDVLDDQGWLPNHDSGAEGNLAYEVFNNGNGWYNFHHHHLHVSLWGWSGKPGAMSGPRCLAEGCAWDPGANKLSMGCRVDEPEVIPHAIHHPRMQ